MVSTHTLTSDQHRAQVPAVGVPGRSLCDCRATRMGSRTVRAQLYKRWDAEQKAAKQAEARLSQCLQRLEETRLRHLALLAREQRQLQTQLQRLREDVLRKKHSCYFGNGIQKKLEGIPVSPPRGEWMHGARRAGQVRAPATNMVQETHKTKSQRPSRHTGPRDPTISKEQSPSQNHRPSRCREDKPPAREKASTRPAKGVMPAGSSLLCQGQDIPAGTADSGPGASRAGDSGVAHSDEARSGDASLQPDHTQRRGTNVPKSPGTGRNHQGCVLSGHLPGAVCKGWAGPLPAAQGAPQV